MMEGGESVSEKPKMSLDIKRMCKHNINSNSNDKDNGNYGSHNIDDSYSSRGNSSCSSNTSTNRSSNGINTFTTINSNNNNNNNNNNNSYNNSDNSSCGNSSIVGDVGSSKCDRKFCTRPATIWRRHYNDSSFICLTMRFNSFHSLYCSILLCLLISLQTVQARSRCYSCASTNMQADFLYKQRGPQKRIHPPRVFDDFCNMDAWIIKERSTVTCNGTCFKWQQIVNNSGSFSYMTLRSCYNMMFDLNDQQTVQEPSVAYCSTRSMPLDCLADANVIEDSCWCHGDYCNSSSKAVLSQLLVITVVTVVTFKFLTSI